MDGLMHNFERKQRLEINSQHNDEGLSGICKLEGEIGHTQGPQSVSIGLNMSPSTDERLKSILKSPTVRFSQALGPSENFEIPKKIAPLENLPVPPSPPPPPPPNAIPLPPSLFNKEIEADKHLNKAAYQLYTKFIDALAAFVDLQGSVIKNRVAIQEKRQEMKRLRGNVAQCDMMIFDHLRQRLAGAASAEDEQLFVLFEASQAARDQAGPMEAEYEPLEVQLGAQEKDLMGKYAELEIRFERFFKLKATSTVKTSVPSEIEYQDSTAPSESDEQI
ncbi:hypothetical protein NX059_005600 [Plenodomus lindquistii]|nr:hypothetical protein NX059_005600 [Plenodomus lindquistii]